MGPVSGSEALQAHPVGYAYSGTLNLASGTLLGGTSTVSDNDNDPKFKAHAILMIVGWGLLTPLGVVFARCKEWGPVWFQLHRLTQVISPPPPPLAQILSCLCEATQSTPSPSPPPPSTLALVLH